MRALAPMSEATDKVQDQTLDRCGPKENVAPARGPRVGGDGENGAREGLSKRAEPRSLPNHLASSAV